MKILIVEDEASIRFVLQEGLEMFTGFKVDAVGDRTAIARAREDHYDLVITDMHLGPDLDGLAIIREISAFDSETRFIVMSGKKEFDVATKVVRASKGDRVAGFLLKPFDLEELFIAVDRVREALPT
jgi:DNA-binding NtrC family response regulator